METNATHSDTDAPIVNPLERRLDLSVAIADLDKDVDQRLKRLGKNAKMPGFRPGKVPANLIRQQYGHDARSDALSDLLGRRFSEAVSEQQLRVAGNPRIEAKTGSETHVEFTAIFEVFPEIQLADLSDVTIERPTLSIGDAEVDGTLEILRKQRVRYEPVSRAAATGDQVTIDFLGKKDGEPFAGGQGKDFRFVLGEGKMLADFEAAVIGAATGDSKSFDLTFPADYFAKELAGQEVIFELTLKEVCQPILPEVDADFAKALGVVDGSLDQMRAEIEQNLQREVKKRLQTRVTRQVMDVLLQKHSIPVPNVLVDHEIEHMMQMMRQQMEQNGVKIKDMPMQREWFAEEATRRVSLGLLFAAIVQEHSLQAKPEQVRALVQEAAQSYEHPEEVIGWYYAQPERLEEVQGAAVEANVVDWVLSQAKVEDQSAVFEELMGQPSS
ncbi:MAG TPA: trigger factor [Accumulibacter sp.]|nr:trigger factor [Accumulibacter sp.]HMW16978.1 trigger factor [Accumulibacter sp.]HMX22147.1 trigger factor [Accumulibacter sp.]HMY06013.1 trigger factor [Accumulibacter sp.]HNC17230.1 trigger factor [Accumulibacter sp.]